VVPAAVVPPQRQAHPPEPPAPQPPEPVFTQQYQPPQYQGQQYQAPQYQPPQYQMPARAGGMGMPTWLLTIIFAFAFFGLGAGIYYVAQYMKGNGAASTPAATVESPAAKKLPQTNPFQKYIEISAVRFLQDAKKNTLVRFVLTNHSEADIADLAGNVTIWGRTQKSEEEAEGTFSFTTRVAPNESKELTAPLNTKRKIYELPDWQNVTTDLQITAPTQ
jgi:hypothetical protein